jgi:hypothetical protein
MIGFNFNDDPAEVAKKWIAKLKMPVSNLPSTAKFVEEYKKYALQNKEKFSTKKKVPRVSFNVVRYPGMRSCKFIPYNVCCFNEESFCVDMKK